MNEFEHTARVMLVDDRVGGGEGREVYRPHLHFIY